MTNLLTKKKEKELITLMESEFGDKKPTKKQMETFVIERNTPTNDGGISIAIAAAAFLLQVYSAYIDAKRRKGELKGFSGQPPKCPKKNCGSPVIARLESGQFICKKGHTWK